MENLPKGATIGTGSPRRKRQILLARPDLECVDVRGNLDTRIRRVLVEKKQDAVVVAQAGLLRLKKYQKYARTIPENVLLPAVGQAALGIQVRECDVETLKKVKRINHEKSFTETAMERDFLRALEGGCRVPVGISSRAVKGKILIEVAVFSTKSSDFLKESVSVSAIQVKSAGKILAKKLLKKGAGLFLKEARS